MRKLGGKCLVRRMHGHHRQKAKWVPEGHSASRSACTLSMADGVDIDKERRGHHHSRAIVFTQIEMSDRSIVMPFVSCHESP